MRTRARLAAALPMLPLLTMLAACDSGFALSQRDAPSFREVTAAEGRVLARGEDVRLLQVGREPRPLAARGAQRVPPGWQWPEELAEATAVVIVGARPDDGFRLAARMARAGIQGVVVVTGGLEAWNEAPALAAAESDNTTMRE